MSVVRESVLNTLKILKSHGLPIGHPSYRSDGSIWKKVKPSGEDGAWKRIRAPFSKNLQAAVKNQKRKLIERKQGALENPLHDFENNKDNQPLLFQEESFKNKRPSQPESIRSIQSLVSEKIQNKKPVFIPEKIKNVSDFRNGVFEKLLAEDGGEKANEYFERSKGIESINTLLNLSYRYVSISSEVSNQITRAIVSSTVKESKRRSEALLGNKNAEGKHDVNSYNVKEIQSNSLVKIVKEFEEIPLSPKDSEFLEKIRDSLAKNLIPPVNASLITDTLSKIPVKEPSIVLKVLKNYISESLLTYNSKIEAKKIDDTNPLKRTVLATKFRNLASNMTAQIEHKENPPISKQNPTRRRAGIAWAMQEDAKSLRKVQAVLKGMAKEIEIGVLPENLKTIRSKADVETILSKGSYFKYQDKESENQEDKPITVQIHRFNTFGLFSKKNDLIIRSNGSIYGHNIELAHKAGLISKEDMEFARKNIVDPKPGEEWIESTDLNEIEKYRRVSELIHKINENVYAKPATEKCKSTVTIDGKKYELYFKGKVYGHWSSNSHNLLKLGFKTTGEVQEAVNQFYRLYKEYSEGEPSEEQIKIKKLEHNLIGSKHPGFFPTPKKIITQMIDLADIKPGMDVLEPSAGKGDIADLLDKKKYNVDTIEKNGTLREILNLKGHTLVDWDFLEFSGKQYDRILMNPPFEKGQDIDHVRHAYSLLKPGGKLVAVMSEGPFFRSDNKAKNFREWLDDEGGYSEKLPDGSFKGPGSFVQTGVSTRLVMIEK
ncbi:methyltransferase [Leptospira sanjuanensis]|uniref:methyltransferase n=1 Tax=Leptospira sanjuanensis TaxID=2879643 RepID=UPI001EE8B139|nr:class I SAM-dependent methyltransferase [Leptospira sanjuanensis]MCG6170236.1 class I SAM-dependent methyltransferase [Leptospira sanjuanensis]